ncbi:MAG TPA: hypothetical protein VFB22_06250 [Candidatus Baltobacteraceae bacterium]|nr:hypothetical protein [Candidatus Baltobacteraceae bacterium]
MTTSRYRRSSVRAVLEAIAIDPVTAASAHDALWAVLWSRRYDDVAEPLWLPDNTYAGVLAFTRDLGGTETLTGIDTGDAFIVFRGITGWPPIGSRVRVVSGGREQWRLGEVVPLGLGVDLHFDEPDDGADSGWIEQLRAGAGNLQRLLDARRDRLAARRAQLGALSEPMSVEEIWREEVSAIGERVTLQTDFTPAEHAALARARAKGARSADEEERRLTATRKRRYTERVNEELARFRDERWPAIRDRALAETKKYAEYRTEVVRLEDAMQRIRALAERAQNAGARLDALARSGFRVRALSFDPARLDEPAYAEELLRTIELLHAAIPVRAVSTATSFSAYRAPTAGPSVSPPRL